VGRLVRHRPIHHPLSPMKARKKRTTTIDPMCDDLGRLTLYRALVPKDDVGDRSLSSTAGHVHR
jgi:hypothetical protein